MTELARRLLQSLAVVLMVALSGLTLTTAAQAQIPYTSYNGSEGRYAAIVVDANSGEVLYAKNADSQRYPASITKVMTLYLAFEAVAAGQLSLDAPMTVSPRAAAQAPTKLGLRAGDTITVGDAMRSVAVKSANDMAVALAEKIGGTESRFAALMTLRAKELGMNNTRFVNASGLPDSRQLSSARDIAILSRAVMRDYPQYYSFFSLKQFAYRGQSMRNHNNLLGKMPGVDGLKTGFTNASGFNLAASAVRNDRRLIAVVLGGNTSAARDNHVEDLLETGFDILQRRKRGEVITVAQNLFETAPVPALAVTPSVEQGDADPGRSMIARDASLHAALGGVSADKVLAEAAKDKKSAKSSKPAKSAKGGDYLVQVGAFRQRNLAQTELKRIGRKFSDQFEDADGRVETAKSGEYRARFAGLSASGAKQACASLKKAGQICVVVPPQ